MSRLILLNDNTATESVGLLCQTPVVLEAAGGVRRWDEGAPTDGPVLAPAERGHVLLTPPGAAQVRGLPLLAGTCRLDDGDVIEAHGCTWRYVAADFLDPERREAIWRPGGAESSPILCAACLDEQRPLQAGDQAVYCPTCGMAFHLACVENPDLAACPVCSEVICRTDEERACALRRGRSEASHEPVRH